MEILDAFKQSQALSKSISTALRKYAVPSGNTTGLSPCVLILEPVFYNAQGSESPSSRRPETKKESGARGEAHAKMIADMNTLGDVVGGFDRKEMFSQHFNKEESDTEPPQLSPNETMGIIADFSQMLDVLADRFNLKRPKRYGNLVSI